MPSLKPLLLILQLLAATPFAFAQPDSLKICNSACCSTDPTPAGIMLGFPHHKGEWMLSYRFMQMQSGGMYRSGRPVPDAEVFNQYQYLMNPDRMLMQMHMLMAMYGLSDRFTLMAMLGYNYNSMQMHMAPGTSMHHHMAGMSMTSTDPNMSITSASFADPKLWLMYRAYSGSNAQVVLSGGLSLPVGSIRLQGSSTDMYAGSRLSYCMQAGSGSVEVLPGITYINRGRRFTFSSQATGTLRTNTNSLGYRLGNEAVWNTWLACLLHRNVSVSTRLEAWATEAQYGTDKGLYPGYEPSADASNSGGKRAEAYIGANYNLAGLAGNYRLAAEYGLPLYQKYNGLQQHIRNVVNLSLTLSF